MSGNQGVLSDNANLEVTMAASFWKDFEVLHTAKYTGEWSCINIKPYVENYIDCNVYLTVRKVSDNSVMPNWTQYRCSIYPTASADVFGNGKTDVGKAHLYYDHTNGNLFVYANTTETHYIQLEFEVGVGYDENDDEIYNYKTYRFPPVKMPHLVVSYTDDNGYHEKVEGKITINMHYPRYYNYNMRFSLIDPDTKDYVGGSYNGNNYYDWGCAGNIGFTDARWDDSSPNIITALYGEETSVQECDTGSDGGVDYILYPPDPYSNELFNGGDFEIKPGTTPVNYSDDIYTTFEHDIYYGGVEIHPVVVYDDSSAPKMKVFEAADGENTYSKMKAGEEAAEFEEFNIIYGIKKSYFITVNNTNNTPNIALSISSSNRPYLQYSLTPIGSGNYQEKEYRLDFWVDRYENPLTLDDTALPYKGQTLDENAGDKTVDITITCGTITKHLNCNVLHKRFELAYNYAKKDFEINWNPFGLIISGSKKISTVQRQYSWDPDEYGLITRTIQAYIPIALPYTNAFPTYNNSLVNELKAPAYILSVYGADGELVQHIHDISGKTFPYNAKTKLVNGDDEIGYGYYLIDDRIVNEEFRALYSQTTHITPIPIAVKIPNDFVSGEVSLSFEVDRIAEKGCSLTGDVNDLRNYISVPPSVGISYTDSGQYDCYYCIETNYVPVGPMDQNIAYYELAHSNQRTSFNNVKNDADLILEYEGMQHRYGGIPFPSFTGKFAFQKYPTASATQHPLIATTELSDNHKPSDYKDKLATPIQFRSARTNGCLAPIKVTNGNQIGDQWIWYPNDPVIVH